MSIKLKWEKRILKVSHYTFEPEFGCVDSQGITNCAVKTF